MLKRKLEELNTYDKGKQPDKKKRFVPKLPINPSIYEKKDDTNEDDTNEDDKVFFFIIPPSHAPQKNVSTLKEKKKNIEDCCRNPLCDHKTYEENPEKPILTTIMNIKTIDDLIEIGRTYHCKKNTEYSGLNLRILCNLIPPLTELSKMIGMNEVKERMVDQILFFLQGEHVTQKCGKCMDCSFGLKCLNSQTEMLHTVITGPPGVGKTELGKILGKVYKEMGILSKGTFKTVCRADLIGQHCGETAIKTKGAIQEATGGVLFIDEAYSLGNVEKRDVFTKECIDTINQCLSENRDFLCIIAGYEDELEKCFFSYNAGLKRRFTFRYDIKPYSPMELFSIFENKIKSIDWSFCYDLNEGDNEEIKQRKSEIKNTIMELFKKNSKKFPNYGGDIETFVLKCKIANSRRCVFKEDEKRKTLSISDIEKGLEFLSKNRKYTKASNNEKCITFYS